MQSKTGIKSWILVIFVISVFMISAFSSIYAIDHSYDESNNESVVNESNIESVQPEQKEEASFYLKIIGEGNVQVTDSKGNRVILDESRSTNEWHQTFSLNEEVKVEAFVKDESDFIYGFYVKYEDGVMNREQITGKGFSHEAKLFMDNDVEVLVVFAEINEMEIVFDNPLNHSDAYAVLPMALGDIGQNWGMYSLFTEYTVIHEFGSEVSYPYSHIIQVDENHDYEYTDMTHTAYCIQYGADCPTGGYLNQSELTVKQRDYLGYALAYGWRQSGTSYDSNQYNTNIDRSEAAVTQGIIWCCASGLFNSAAGDAAMETIIEASYLPEHSRVYYQKLKNTILNIDTKPSFDEETLILEWNKENNRYEATVHDTNGMIEHYNYTGSGISFVRNGNDLTVFTTNEYPNGIRANAKRIVYGGKESVVTWDGWYDKQDMATYIETSREIVSEITVKTKDIQGKLEIKKSSSSTEITNGNTNYSLENAVYGVFSDKACKIQVGTLITNASGCSQKKELAEGTYYVKEIKASKGYSIDSNVYTVSVASGKDTLLEVKEVPVTGKIVLTKTIHTEDINFDNGNPMFTFKLTGNYPDGSKRLYYQIVDFSKECVKTNTDSKGDVHLSVVFDDLVAGTYTAKELPTSRYVLENITSIENGIKQDETVLFSITSETSMQGSAQFINDNYEQQNYSDSAKVINKLKK